MNRGLFLGLGLLLGLGVGAAIGVLFLGGSGGGSGSDDAPLSGTRPAWAGGPERASGADTPSPIGAEDFASSARALRDAVGEIEAPPDPSLGSPAAAAAAPGGTITGVVYSDRGEPVPGALVRAERQIENDDADAPVPEKPGSAPPPDEDPRAIVSLRVEEEVRKLGLRRSARTGDDGAYVLPGLKDGKYSIQAWAKDCQVQVVEGQRGWQVRPGARVDFVATRMLTVPVAVRFKDGTSPARARIGPVNRSSWRPSNPSSGQVWTPASPDIRLSAGVHQLVAWVGRHQEVRSMPAHVFVDPAKPPEAVVFELGGFTAVRGRVLAPREQEGRNFSVHIHRIEGGNPPDDQKLLNNGQSWWISPGDEPEYYFGDLAAGVWRIGLQIDQRGLAWSETVTLDEGRLTEKDIPVPGDTNSGGVVVRVVGPEGGLLRSATVWVSMTAGGGGGGGSHENVLSSRAIWNERFGNFDGISYGESGRGNSKWSVKRQRDGTFLAQRTGSPGPQDGTPLAAARASGFGTRSVPIPAAGVGEVEIRMEPPGLLEVRVAGAEDPKKQPPFTLGLRPRDARPGGNNEDLGGVNSSRIKEGRSTFGPVQPGSYDIIVNARGRTPVNAGLTTFPVEVRPGLNSTTVSLPALHRLQVAVARDAGINRVSIGPGGEEASGSNTNWFDNQEPDAEGLVTFENLLAGDYRVGVFGRDGQKTMPVRVPTGAILRFESAPERALRVRKAEPGSYFATAGIQAGDVIIGVNGEAFDGERPATTVLNGLMMARRTNNLIIRRGEQTLEIGVEAAKFSDEQQRVRALEGIAR